MNCTKTGSMLMIQAVPALPIPRSCRWRTELPQKAGEWGDGKTACPSTGQRVIEEA